MFRGRESVHQEFGMNMINDVIEVLSDVAKLENPVKKEGRNLVAYFVKN